MKASFVAASLFCSMVFFPLAAFSANDISGSIINKTNDLIYSNPATDGFPIVIKKDKTEPFKYVVVPAKGKATAMQILYRVKSNAAVVCTVTVDWDIDQKNNVTFKPIVAKGKCSKAA